LKVYLASATGNVLYCNNCSEFNSTILSCSPSVGAVRGSFHAEGWMNTTGLRSTYLKDNYVEELDNSYSYFGQSGLLISILVVGTLAGIGVTIGGAWAMGLVVIGLITMKLIGIIQFGWVPIIIICILLSAVAIKMRV
jgi:hypothetical protein